MCVCLPLTGLGLTAVPITWWELSSNVLDSQALCQASSLRDFSECLSTILLFPVLFKGGKKPDTSIPFLYHSELWRPLLDWQLTSSSTSLASVWRGYFCFIHHRNLFLWAYPFKKAPLYTLWVCLIQVEPYTVYLVSVFIYLSTYLFNYFFYQGKL